MKKQFVLITLLIMVWTLSVSGESLMIPENTVAIESQAFYNDKGVVEVIFPDSLLRIGSLAFAGTGLTYVTLTGNLEEIAPDAFDGEVIFSAPPGSYAAQWIADNNRLASQDPPQELEYEADEADPRGRIVITGYTGTETELILPDAIGSVPVYRIGESAFANNSNLVSVSLPKHLEAIDENAFHSCDNLTELILPDTVSRIGAHAFANCSAMTKLLLPEALDTFGDGAFQNCTGLTEISISVSARNTANTFNGVNSVTTIHYLKGSDGVMPDYTDSSQQQNSRIEHICRQTLTSVIFSEGISHIGNYAFYSIDNQYMITSVGLPSSLRSIGANSFSYLTHLTSLVLPEGLQCIGPEAFRNSALEQVTYPGSLESIGDYAFFHCSSLPVPHLPDSVTIGEDAFAECLSEEPEE